MSAVCFFADFFLLRPANFIFYWTRLLKYSKINMIMTFRGGLLKIDRHAF